MATWQNYGWLREPLQNWAVKQPGPKRDFRRNCIIWSREEMEAQAKSFERARAELRAQGHAGRPHPTPRHRRVQDFAPPHGPGLGAAAAPAQARSVVVEPGRRRGPITQDWVRPDPLLAPASVAHAQPPASIPRPSTTLLDPTGFADLSVHDLAIGILLVVLPPFGVMLLWTGKRDRDTKVVTTVVAMMWMLAVTLVILAGILA